jgi:hypothetical protein
MRLNMALQKHVDELPPTMTSKTFLFKIEDHIKAHFTALREWKKEDKKPTSIHGGRTRLKIINRQTQN